MKLRIRLLFVPITLAVILSLGSCSPKKITSGSITVASQGSEVSVMEQAMRLSGERRLLVEEASTWIGTPYKYAGDEKGKGTDCSGLVMRVVESALNFKIPRNSAKQAEFCIRIKEEEADGGDLVFFATGKDPKRISHVGLMLDPKSFIHASSSKGVVVSSVSSPYYHKRLIMYGRLPRHPRLN